MYLVNFERAIIAVRNCQKEYTGQRQQHGRSGTPRIRHRDVQGSENLSVTLYPDIIRRMRTLSVSAAEMNEIQGASRLQ